MRQYHNISGILEEAMRLKNKFLLNFMGNHAAKLVKNLHMSKFFCTFAHIL